MAALQCEICGGKLVGKPGGLFECEYCGMEYNTDWAKAKIQEIKGTVKVEGTVQVTGTVKVEGGVSAESLLKRGWMALEDEKWEEAIKAFDQVLNLEPENARAHLGRYFGNKNIRTMKDAEEKYEKFFYIPPEEKERCPVCKGTKFVLREDGLRVCYVCGEHVEAQETRGETQRIRKLADPELAQWFSRMDAQIQQQKEEAKRKEKEDAERAAEERRRSRKEALARLPAIRQRIEKVQGKIFSASLRHTVGIKTDGTVVAVGDNEHGKCNVDGWRDVVAVCTDEKHTVGLKSDGTVAVLGDWGYRQEDVSGWRDIVAVSTSQYHIVGLKSNGTVVAAGNMNKDRCEVDGWRDIVAIGACEEYTVGLKQDGTVAITNEDALAMDQLEDWHSIIAIAVGHSHVVGLRADGTVVAAGWDFYGSCNVNDWYDIVAIDAGSSHTVGLKADGTVVAAGNMSDGCCKVSGWQNVVAISAAPYHTAAVRADGTVVMAGKSPDKWNTWKLFNNLDNLEQERKAAPGNREAHIARLAEIRSRVSIAQKGILAMGEYHVAGLKINGTVVAAGNDEYNKCSVNEWKDITAVAAGYCHTVGVRADGTVAVTAHPDRFEAPAYWKDSHYYHGQCGVENWKDIVSVAAGSYHTVGLKSDGTVVVTNYMEDGGRHDKIHKRGAVKGWADIVAVAANRWSTVGLKSDGTVVTTDKKKELGSWQDIVAIDMDLWHIVGLKADGSVVAAGQSDDGQCSVGKWRNIVGVAAGERHTVGLKADGTVVAVGNNRNNQCDVSSWRDIAIIVAGGNYTLGVKTDGTIVKAGSFGKSMEATNGWKLFGSVATLEQERKSAKAEKVASERRSAGVCQHCGGELKGFFSKKCTVCGKPKDY